MDGKKASILCILKILEEYTDEEHSLTQEEIIEKLKSKYDIEMERKSIASSLKILEELGYDINKGKRGVALYQRIFDKSQIRFLADAVFSSKAISGKQASSLVKTLYSVLSINDRQNFRYIHKADDITRTDFKDVFLNIEVINEAIEKGKWIEFKYQTYDKNGNRSQRFDGYAFHLCPHFLVNTLGHYYVLGYRSNHKDLTSFRLDKLEDLIIVEGRDMKPLPPGFSITDYLNSHIYLFGGEEITAVLEVLNPESIQYIYDWFGKNAKIKKTDEKLIATVKTSEDSFFYWFMQYQSNFKLIEPASTLNRVKQTIKKMLETYGD